MRLASVLVLLTGLAIVHAGKPEVLANAGELDGNVIGEAAVVDLDNMITLRRNYRTNIMEDFKTGYMAMKNVKRDGKCAILPMSKGHMAQVEEERNMKARAGRLYKIRSKVFGAKVVGNVRKVAGGNIRKFCRGRSVVELVENATVSKRGIIRKVWDAINGEWKIKIIFHPFGKDK